MVSTYQTIHAYWCSNSMVVMGQPTTLNLVLLPTLEKGIQAWYIKKPKPMTRKV